jgi:hypothetical protein
MRYFIVAWDQYYPSSGLGNIKGESSSLEGAIEIAKMYCEGYDNVQVYDNGLQLVEDIK